MHGENLIGRKDPLFHIFCDLCIFSYIRRSYMSLLAYCVE